MVQGRYSHTYRIGDRHTPVPSPDLTQDNPQVKLDEALAEGHSFRLDDANEDDGTIRIHLQHTNITHRYMETAFCNGENMALR